tara:strand:- start:1106 stop:2296 length:1191 start_codon:yes stop_codon:yes gene_type:complete
MISANYPKFKDSEFLISHIKSIMSFYHPQCIDKINGGFFQHFKDDGSIYDFDTRHLVSSTRFIFNYSMAAIQFNKATDIDAAQHGIDYLRQHHLNRDTGGYAWILNSKDSVDSTNYCYGLAFVLLAYSTAYKAGIKQAKDYLEEVFELMEQNFWSDKYGLYADEANSDWSLVSKYRGQNANMHSCEALIAAFEATSDKKYLDRAILVAKNICVRQASLADGLIWEHYDEDWQIDWSFNKNAPDDLFRPWGFQVGHLAEWSKLLIILERYSKEDWLLPRAKELFDDSIEMGWDEKEGGFFYGFAPNGDVCDNDKYFWVQAESLAAAAVLAHRTSDEYYWSWYERIWKYSWRHMIDHQYGAWYRVLDRDNNKYNNLKSPAGKTDYHTMGACYEILKTI